MPESPHNHQATPAEQAPYTRRSAEWLDALVTGRQVDPSNDSAPVKPAVKIDSAE